MSSPFTPRRHAACSSLGYFLIFSLQAKCLNAGLYLAFFQHNAELELGVPGGNEYLDDGSSVSWGQLESAGMSTSYYICGRLNLTDQAPLSSIRVFVLSHF